MINKKFLGLTPDLTTGEISKTKKLSLDKKNIFDKLPKLKI